MENDFFCTNFGDSARVNPEWELKLKDSNHVFNGAGENVQYHSDSESQASKKSKTRYINPAICVETVESSHSVTSLQTESSCVEELTPHPHSTYRSNSTPLLSAEERLYSSSSSSIKRKSCRLVEEYASAKCEEEEETPRCNRTYREDGADTFRLSVASVSTSATAHQERAFVERKRQEAFNAWLARKEQEQKRERALKQKKKRRSPPAPTLEQREECYRRWLEGKRTQKERVKAEEIMRQYRETERLEQERLKREREKEEKLADWIRRKEEDIKAMKTKEERRAARAAIADERRRANGERAYRDWLRSSKNKPLPVPLNKGELSMRGSVSQMYINPIPWQSS